MCLYFIYAQSLSGTRLELHVRLDVQNENCARMNMPMTGNLYYVILFAVTDDRLSVAQLFL